MSSPKSKLDAPTDLSSMISAEVGDGPEKSTDSFVNVYPDSAVLVSGDGTLLSANDRADELARAINAGSGGALAELIKSASQGQGGTAEAVPVGDGLQYDLTAVPVSDSGDVLVLGRDQSFEHNMFSALVESRARYRDMVEISSDFYWETGLDGCFVFVSPGGALGYSTEQLIGRNPIDLLVNDESESDLMAFVGAEISRDLEIQVFCEDGVIADLLLSAVPLFDADNEFRGTRGICRDVTEERRNRTELDVVRIREKLLKHLIGIIRDEVEPQRSLTSAIRFIVQTSGFAGCKILKRSEFGDSVEQFELAAQYGATEGAPPDDVIRACIESIKKATPVVGEESTFMLAPTGYRQQVNGCLCVWHIDAEDEWSDDDRKLVDSIADQLGIAIERVMHHERILHLSRTDELTGLLNRRSFLDEELPRRMDRLRRSNQPAALLFVDLDNFKSVNDSHGHQRGDEALIAMAQFLTDHSRPGDAVARFGGDEFAMWLNGMNKSNASNRAKLMVEDSKMLTEFSGSDENPLGISVGVALYDPNSDETVDQLLARADAAMYSVKRDGKGGYAVDDEKISG